MQAILVVHLSAAITALLVGAFQLTAPKGTGRHKKIGWLWLSAMSTTAITSFGLHGFATHARFSVIHLLSVWILICVVAAVYFARTKQIKRHRRFTVGAYVGLIMAALGTLAPGRLISTWLFNA